MFLPNRTSNKFFYVEAGNIQCCHVPLPEDWTGDIACRIAKDMLHHEGKFLPFLSFSLHVILTESCHRKRKMGYDFILEWPISRVLKHTKAKELVQALIKKH